MGSSRNSVPADTHILGSAFADIIIVKMNLQSIVKMGLTGGRNAFAKVEVKDLNTGYVIYSSDGTLARPHAYVPIEIMTFAREENDEGVGAKVAGLLERSILQGKSDWVDFGNLRCVCGSPAHGSKSEKTMMRLSFLDNTYFFY